MKRKLLIFTFLLFQFSFGNVNFLFVYDNYNDITLNNPEIPNLNPLTVCDTNNDGFAVFNLSLQSPIILAAQSGSSSNYTVTYHESFTDASLGISPLNASSYDNINPYSQTIYYRIVDNTTSEYAVGSFSIEINIPPQTLQPNYPTYSLCDSEQNGIGYEVFDLQSQIANILMGQTGMSVHFYPNLQDAQNDTNEITDLNYINPVIYVQTLGIRVTNESTGCYSISIIDIRVESSPTLIQPASPYLVCENFYDGFAQFDLSSLVGNIDQGANYIITFHETLIDAQTGVNPLPTLYTNISPTMTIYVRALDPITGCVGFTTVQLIVSPYPIFYNLPSISVCDSDSNPYNGSTLINLDLQTPIVLAQQVLPASSYSVTYYTSVNNAEAGIAPIVNSAAFLATNGQTIWVRCENIYTGCYYVGSFSLEINIPLQVTTPTPLNKCDDDSSPNDQYSNFDLTVKIPFILQGAVGCVVDFYPSLANAYANTNQITTPTNYVNIVPVVQTLGVKVTNSSGCVSYTTLNIRVLPNPYINYQMPNFISCDVDGINDGMMFYENNANGLAGYVDNILGATQMSLGFSVHFYTNLIDAQNNIFANAIPNLSTYQVQTGTYYVTVSNPDGCFAIDAFNVSVQQLPEPIITTNTGGNTACVDWNETIVNNNLILDSNISNAGHTFSWYKDAMLITGVNSSTLTITDMAENNVEYSVIATSTSFLGCQSDITNFPVVRSGTASPINGSGYVVTNLSGVQSITVTVAGFGIYQFQLDNNLPQDNGGVFEDVSIGTHTINVIDYGGCGVLTLTVEITESLVPAPDGLNSQSFTEGQTLADIVVSGENIQWYSSANGTTPLPLNTPLVNGVTYYATQTVNGTESVARLAVTVTVALGVSENQLLNVLLSPNPSKHAFQLQSRDVLKSIELYNLLGQKVLEQQSNSTQLSVDISHLHSGNYILKVYSENGQKTLRFIKE